MGRGRRVVDDARAGPASRPEHSARPRPVRDGPCLQGIAFVLYTGIPWPPQLPLAAWLRLLPDLLAAAGAMAGSRCLRQTAPDAALGKLITTAANVNDGTQTLALVESPAGRRPRRPLPRAPRRSPGRQGLRQQPQPKGTAGEQTFALLHQFKRLAVPWEHRDLHDAFASLTCGPTCWGRLWKRYLDRPAAKATGRDGTGVRTSGEAKRGPDPGRGPTAATGSQ